MPAIKFSGPLSKRVTSFLALNRIAIGTYVRHALGCRIDASWDSNLEIGVQFIRHQFTQAMRDADFAKGRLIFDSLVLQTSDKYEVDCTHQKSPKGHWFIPHHKTSKATVLYLHGGGYAFHAATSFRFAAMLAHRIGASVFMPDYRLTPEHPHPAQAEDAFSAWQFLVEEREPEEIVVVGDSAGGHMMLILLRELKARGHSQPAMGIGLCPWTDIGERGRSFYGNDRYDLIQGWMARQFGKWLDPDGKFGREKLSPISYNYTGLAPLYLQAGGREVLYDMICEFAEKQTSFGADILFDVWLDMPHDFQLMDSTQTASITALVRITTAVRHAMNEEPVFASNSNTVVASGKFDKPGR